MAGNGWKWFLGCGIGCAVVLLVLAAVIGGGVFFVRDIVNEAQQTEEMASRVTERFGEVEDYRPAPGGAVPAERLEAFLRVRDLMAAERTAMEDRLLLLSGEEASDGRGIEGGAFSKVRAGVGLIHHLFGFYNARYAALLEGGMGLGEYYYLYTLAYYGWLDKSPADGPPYRLVGGNENMPDWSADRSEWDDEEIRRWSNDQARNADPEAIRESREERTRLTMNRLLLPVLENQLADAREAGDGDWVEALAAEVAAMESDASRLPWQGGLPPVIVESLAPFRERLEQSYSPTCNALESGLTEGDRSIFRK